MQLGPEDAKALEEIQGKIAIEQKVLQGAAALYHAANPAVREATEASMVESKRRLEFLEGLVRDLQAKAQSSNSVISKSSSEGTIVNLIPTISSFELIKYGNAITADKVRFRLNEIIHKLETEKSLRAGTESLMNAVKEMGGSSSQFNELKDRLLESNTKIDALEKARRRYNALYVPSVNDQDEFLGEPRKSTGRLKLKLIGVSNLMGRTEIENEIVAKVLIDGTPRYTTRHAVSRWDETLEIIVDRNHEAEIGVYSYPGGVLLSMQWFKLADLEDDVKKRYPHGMPANVNDCEDTWIDIEPTGQLLLRAGFVAVSKVQAQRDQIYRRGAVQKAYLRNGHRFYATTALMYACAVCNEGSSAGTLWYQCQSCNYVCHAKCFNNVITKCISQNDIARAQPGQDLNTGQLLSYRIPHRFQAKTIVFNSWCGHCGCFLGPGSSTVKCIDCGKCAHSYCKQMMPNFCQLTPEMAITLVGAFEEVERMKNLRDMEEMERAEKARKENESKLPPALAAPVVFTEELTSVTNQFNQNVKIEEIPISIPIMQPPQQPQPTPKRPKQGEVETFLQGRMKPSVEIQRPRPENLNKPRQPVKMSDFDLVAVLGRGAFGKVLLVEEKSTHQTFAIKALKKDHIIQDDGVESAKLEKRIFQIATEHPFLVNMHSSFQDENRLFFVMEYVRGGDLMGHIQQKKYFSLARTKFYACEVLLALEFLHANRIIYRDLKLENILMCADGHIKVADYGICKENIDFGDKTRTFCGTPDYMAPEILNGEKYGRAVDWWSFGILIYVMLHGRYPYNGATEKDILKAIYAGKVEFPRKTQTEADIADLLSGLLEKDPRRRLGGGRDDANEIKRHPYFAGIDWNAFMERRVPPPWRPEVKHDKDFSNFEAEFTEQAADLTPMNTVVKPSDQAKFNDFDFVAAWAGHQHSRS